MMANIKGNGVFWADPYDSMANNIFRQTGYVDPQPGMLAGVNPARHANTELKLSGSDPVQQAENTLQQVQEAESSGGFWSSLGNGLLSAAETILPMLLDPEPSGSEIDSSTGQSRPIDRDCYEIQLQRAIRTLQKLNAVADLDIITQVVNMLATEITQQRQAGSEFITPTKAIQTATLKETPSGVLMEMHMVPADRTITRVQHNIVLKNFAKQNQLRAKCLKVQGGSAIARSSLVNLLPSMPKSARKKAASSNKDPQDSWRLKAGRGSSTT